MNTTANDRILWQMDLARRYGVDRVTIYKWERAAKLPPPDVVIGRRRGRYEASLREFERTSTTACPKNPKVWRTPKPAEIVGARGKAGLTQAAAAELVYSAERTWQNWENGDAEMHPAYFELFLLKTGQSELGVIRPGTIETPPKYL